MPAALSSNVVCAVCLGDFTDAENVGCLQACGHVFHAACIKQVLGGRARGG